MMERPRLELREREETAGDWKEVRTWLVRALKEMPEARARLIEELERARQGATPAPQGGGPGKGA